MKKKKVSRAKKKTLPKRKPNKKVKAVRTKTADSVNNNQGAMAHPNESVPEPTAPTLELGSVTDSIQYSLDYNKQGILEFLEAATMSNYKKNPGFSEMVDDIKSDKITIDPVSGALTMSSDNELDKKPSTSLLNKLTNFVKKILRSR